MVAHSPGAFPSLSAHAALLCGTLLAVLPSCGGGEEPKTEAGAGPAPAASGTAQDSSPARPGRSAAPVTLTAEEPYGSSEFGALHGTILFTGAAPERFPLGAVNNAECKHHSEVDQRSNEIVVADGKLAGVFVALDSGFDRAHIPPAPDTPVLLEQKGCMYVPRVVALRVGQPLRVTNADPTNHNVHTRAKRNESLNRNMGAQQPPLEFKFDKAERPVPFGCDIHPWMGAAVFVEEHPWFAVSDEHGAFQIRDVPPGKYVVEATHEKLGKVSGTVTVQAGKSTGFTLTLSK